MDYTTQKLSFKIKKLLRYLRLYGLKRTLIKVKGQYHMNKKFETLPPFDESKTGGRHVGLIGCGNFQYSNIAYYLRKYYGKVIRGAMDIDINRAASLYSEYKLSYYTDDAAKIISDPEIDLVYIASNHASHTEYAIEALKAGKHVHIEKPHAVNMEQLERLGKAMLKYDGRVGLGFNRPNSKIGRTIREYLNTQSGTSMFNWFVAGHEIALDHWYFKEEEGGRILGNLCHWTDFIFQMMPEEDRHPITIIPARSEKSDCDISVNYVFGDGSIAVITFSAKGHTFEGVRERFAAHRGDVLIAMDDFRDLTVEVVDKKHKVSPMFRDHGHGLNIKNSYDMTSKKLDSTEKLKDIKYIWETAELVIKTREALETNEIVKVESFESHQLSEEP